MRCREGILLELVERLQAKVVTQLLPKAVTKAFLQLVLEVFPPKVIPKCTAFFPAHHPAWFVVYDQITFAIYIRFTSYDV